MRHFQSLEGVHLQDTWLTIGTFDGVHLGHQDILQKLVSKTRESGSKAVVLTFYPHPAVVIGKRTEPFYLTTPEERAELFAGLGVDVAITLPFTPRIAKITARDFISLLKLHIDMQHLMVGPDFALGHEREGNIQYLSELGDEFDYQLSTILPVKMSGEVVSSSRIRAALKDGDIELANQLLGRPYFVKGQVVPGDGRGHTIGIPTANLSHWTERALPKSGVYVTRAFTNGRSLGSVTNIGIRPTFKSTNEQLHIETHLLDFNDQIYGLDVKLEFIRQLRDEVRFPSIEALINQIQQDIASARNILAEQN